MRQALVVLVVLAVCLVGFGFYRGWFAMSSHDPAAGNDDVNINLSTDKGKFDQDVQTVKDKTSELTGSSTEEGPAEPDNRTEGSLNSDK